MSGVYDTLISPFRAIVDRLAKETEAEGWEVRRAYLVSVYSALERGRRNTPALDPEASLSGIIAGLIEKLGDPEIDGRLQAGIYAASLRPEHRQASAEWFDRNPEEFARIQQELASGGARLH